MAANDQSVCKKCGNALAPADKFCASCGTAAAAAPESPRKKEQPSVTGPVRCSLCGHQNKAGAAACTSCGNSLGPAGAAAPQRRKQQPGKPKSVHATPLTFFQSWKFTASFAAILIVGIILYKNYKPADTQAPVQAMSPNAAAAVEQIETLQKLVDANPKDADQTLRLANMLHDVRMYPRAAAMYTRYLQLIPTNPDARVDLGTTYFELSMTDSTRRVEYLASAKTEMEKALTYAPRHQLAHFNLGIISLHDGNMEDANSWFSKCAAIDSTTEAGKRASQLLHQHSFTNPQ